MSIQAKIIAILLATISLGVSVYWYGHHEYASGARYTEAIYQAAIEKQKAEAAGVLAAETGKVLARERELADLRAKQEREDAEHEKTVAGLQARLHAAAGPAGRLRDPNAARCGGCGGSTQDAPAAGPGSRPADRAEAGGLLSAELTGLLQRLQHEADTINIAYASCRADAYAVRVDY